MTRFLRPLLTVGVALTSTPPALAETVVQDVTVTASIEAACTVNSPVLDFGTYEPNDGTDRTATTQIIIECPEGARFTIRLHGGMHHDGTDRRMARGGGNLLRYKLYTEGGTQVWGDGGALGPALSRIYADLDPKPEVLGKIPAGQSVAPGTYTDTVMITVDVNAE